MSNHKLIQIRITSEMEKRASLESAKRNAFIKHHFEVEHLNSRRRDEIGFYGEFACSVLFKQDWKANIRDNYLTIDSCDIIVKEKVVDVKTETIPNTYFKKIIERTIKDDDTYGRRLIHKGQCGLLTKYDIVVFGIFKRYFYDFWYPIGWLEAKYILANYKPTTKRPNGRGEYPFSAMPVRTSELKDISLLL